MHLPPTGVMGDSMLEALEVTKDTSLETKRRRALVVEDDADMRMLFKWMLRKEGYEVIEADGGVALLRWINRTALPPWTTFFDLIVSDIRMPDLTAIQVLSAMRNTVTGTPVILVTAYDDAATRREALELGVSAVLAKPVARDDLRSALRSVGAALPDGPVGEVPHA